MKRMKTLIALGATLGLVIVSTHGTWALEGIVKSVAEGCNEEIRTYCSTVTPGEGRVLACLFSHEDKLSGRCQYALYDAAVQLERAVAALTYVANECDADLETYCANIRPGEGRLAQCLKKNEKKLNQRCTQAIKDVGLEVR